MFSAPVMAFCDNSGARTAGGRLFQVHGRSVDGETSLAFFLFSRFLVLMVARVYA